MVVVLAVGSPLLPVIPAAAANTEKAGDLLAVLLPATGYGGSFFSGDREGQRQQEKSLAVTVAISCLTKALVDHDGPNGKGHSFPSGHAALSFAGAANIQRRFGWHYGLPALLAAAFVGYSRVDSDQHHWADVLAGAAVGGASAWYFVTPGDRHLTLTPLVGDREVGLALAGVW